MFGSLLLTRSTPCHSLVAPIPGGLLTRLAQMSAAFALVVSSPVWAEKADRNEPLNFAADAAWVDDTQHLNILTGNVEITKGTMVLRSDRVEVKQHPDGSQTATALGGAGGRAYFRQKRDGVDESIEGEAEKIVYESAPDTVHLSSRAIMRRLNGKTIVDQVTGQAILYDNKTSIFQVLGAAGTTDATGAPAKGRVRGVITPHQAAPAASQSEGH